MLSNLAAVSPSRLIFVIDIREPLTGTVSHDEGRANVLDKQRHDRRCEADTKQSVANDPEYERGKDRIGLNTALALCRRYGVTLDWI